MLDLSLQIACSPVTQGLPEENQAAVDPERVRVQWLLSKAPRLDSLDETWRPFNADGNRIETGMAIEAAWAGGCFCFRAMHMTPPATMASDVRVNRMERVQPEPTVEPNGRTAFPARPTCAG